MSSKIQCKAKFRVNGQTIAESAEVTMDPMNTEVYKQPDYEIDLPVKVKYISPKIKLLLKIIKRITKRRSI